MPNKSLEPVSLVCTGEMVYRLLLGDRPMSRVGRRQRQAEDLVEALADGGDANTQRSALFPRHGVAQFGVDADLCFDVLGEGAIGVVCWVAWISSAIGLIMGR